MTVVPLSRAPEDVPQVVTADSGRTLPGDGGGGTGVVSKGRKEDRDEVQRRSCPEGLVD